MGWRRQDGNFEFFVQERLERFSTAGTPAKGWSHYADWLPQGAREAAAETEKAQRTIQVTVMREHFFKAKPPSDGERVDLSATERV